MAVSACHGPEEKSVSFTVEESLDFELAGSFAFGDTSDMGEGFQLVRSEFVVLEVTHVVLPPTACKTCDVVGVGFIVVPSTTTGIVSGSIGHVLLAHLPVGREPRLVSCEFLDLRGTYKHQVFRLAFDGDEALNEERVHALGVVLVHHGVFDPHHLDFGMSFEELV